MNSFFKKNKGEGDNPEDFVLFNSDDKAEVNSNELVSDDIFYDEETGEYVNTDSTDEVQDTAKINLDEVAAGLDKNNDALREESDDDEYEYEYEEVNVITYFIRNHRLVSICAGIVILALLLSASAYGIITYTNPLRKYAQVVASKENIMRTMDVEGTLELGERYNITSLVAGKIVTSEYEVGDKVNKGDVLYKIDDTDAKLSVERAQNDLAKASDSSLRTNSSLGNMRIVATEAGVIKSLTIKQGSKVNAGSTIGTILKTDGTTVPLISYVSGTIAVLSVNVGRTVAIGQVIASLESENTINSEESSKYEKKSGEIDVQSAQRQLENYTIKAPVSGVVVEKYNKVGDNVSMTNDNNPMMVIIDDSTLTLKFDVDEYRVREMEKGLDVTVTALSLPTQTFAGEIAYVSSEGKADEEGNPRYEVGVTISEPEGLKAGMKVKAKVVLASSNKAVSVPEDALLMSDGQNALVLVKNEENAEAEDRFADESFENELAHPDIKVPKGCSLVTVRYGISDGTIVEILSGIEVGDVVVYKPDEDNYFVIASSDNSDDTEKDKSDSDKSDNSDYSVSDSKDEKIEKDIRDAIDDILNDSDSI